MKTWIRILGIAALVAGAALANLKAGGLDGFTLYGEVISTSPRMTDLTLELQSMDSVGQQTTSIDASGQFEIKVTKLGRYSLRITGTQGQILLDQSIEIGSPHQFLSITLPKSPEADISTEGTVSAHQLSRKIPESAQKMFHKGEEAVRKHKDEEAVKDFKEAIAQDPEFADAYNELGVSLLAIGQSVEAVEQFRRAVDLVPDHRQALYNMCIVLGKLRQWHEAKEVARRNLELDEDQPPINFILAVSLIMDGGDQLEALNNLKRASSEIPKAHLVAANVLEQQGRRNEAVSELQQYLSASVPDDPDLVKVRDWLAQLQQ